MAQWSIRTATPDDAAILVRMLAHAAYPPWHRPLPTPGAIRRDPRTARYVVGWGREGDGGVVALDRGGRRIGAAWYRLLAGEDRGHGWLDDRTPEVIIGIGPRWRGRGVGTALMRQLLALAVDSRVRSLSLSVSTANPAAEALYRRVGFETVRETDGHLLMVWSPT
jgi:ribosomal protein S18 acetylase RimI-like enzyme